MSAVRRSLFFSISEKAAVAVINLLTTATLARLFTAAELGTIAIAFAVNMVLQTVREFGVSPYLVQKAHVSHDDLRAAFTVSLVISTTVAGIIALLSSPLAHFYDEPALRDILRVTALSALVMPLLEPVMGMLRRDMQFSAIARINVASALVNLLSIIGLAWAGLGVVSMVWASIIGSLTAVLGSALFRPRQIIVMPTLRGLRQVLAFGSYSSAASGLNVAQVHLPQMVIGSVLGMAPLGLLSRAMAVSRLFDRLMTEALQPVLLPAMAVEHRSGGDLKRVYLQSLTLMTAVSWPFLTTLAILAEPVVRILLGPDWLAATPLVQVMALAAMPLFPAFLTQPLLISLGRVRDVFMIGLISVPLTVALVTVAAQVGIEAAAAVGFITHPLQVGLALRYIRRHVPFTWAEFFGSLTRSVIVTATTAVPALLVQASLDGTTVPWLVSAGAVAGAAACGWILGLLATRHPITREMSLIMVKLRPQPAGTSSTGT